MEHLDQQEASVSAIALAAQDLSCERDGRLLFSALNLQLSAGTLLQVAGPNGSGKTSLLRLLAGLMPPSVGQVYLQGEPLRKHPERLAQTLLWIGHATGIKALMTAEENLSWLCALNQQSVSRAHIWQALASVGLRGFEDVPCHTLSAGQQRRVALARLYLNPPPLWILDEPFTALDQQAVAALEQHLARHAAAGGLVVFTTHHVWAEPPTGFRVLDLGQKAA